MNFTITFYTNTRVVSGSYNNIISWIIITYFEWICKKSQAKKTHKTIDHKENLLEIPSQILVDFKHYVSTHVIITN